MEEKQINKRLRRRFTGIGWCFLGYYLVMNILAIIAMSLEAILQVVQQYQLGNYDFNPENMNMDVIAGNAWGYVAAIGVALVVLYAWKGSDYWREEIFAKSGKINAKTFLLLLSLCIGVQMVNSLWIQLLELILMPFGKSVMTQLESVSGSSDTFSMFLYASILAPLSEEILFRGFALRTLKPYGKRFAIIGSAILFGLFHGNVLQAPFAILVGLILGYVTVEYSIVWAIALHMVNNLLLADAMTRLMNLLPELAANVFSLLFFSGFFIASICILIIKRHRIGTYRREDPVDKRCMKCFFTNSGVIVLMLLMIVTMALLIAAM